MAQRIVLGKDHKIYYQSTGTRAAWPTSGAAPSLVEIDDARDVGFNGDPDEWEATRRKSGGFKEFMQTLRNVEVSFDIVRDTAAAAWEFIEARWADGAVFGCAVLDGASGTAGTKGIWFDACVTGGYEWQQQLTEGGVVEVTFKNTVSEVVAERVTVG